MEQFFEAAKHIISTESSQIRYNCHSFTLALMKSLLTGQPFIESSVSNSNKELEGILNTNQYTLNLEAALCSNAELITFHVVDAHKYPLILKHSGVIAPLGFQIGNPVDLNSCLIIERAGITDISPNGSMRIWNKDHSSSIGIKTLASALKDYPSKSDLPLPFAYTNEVRYYCWNFNSLLSEEN